MKIVDNDRHWTVKRDTSAQEGSGTFVDVTNDSAINIVSALMNVSSHTTIRLEPGNYTLEEFVLVQNVMNVTLAGTDNERDVSIHCADGAGLAFINVSYLTIRNITIDGCGFTGGNIENTTDILNNTVNIFYAFPPVIRVGMLLGHCESLTMENVIVKNTRGFGLVGINVIGVSQLRNVLFVNNTNSGVCNASKYSVNPSELIAYDSANQLGGATAFMFFDYHNNQTIYQGSKFMLSLQGCTFTSNAECSLIYLNLLRSPGRGESRFVTDVGYRLGGSGAFALALAQRQYGINLNVTSSFFSNNSATFGGGFLITLFAGVHDTHVTFNDCWFNASATAIYSDVRQPAHIGYDPSSPGRDTAISMLNSNFTNSQILTTGSLFIYSNYYTAVGSNDEVVKIYIDRCVFGGNRAFIGSAIVIYEFKINGFAVGIQVSIKDTDFIDNEILTADRDAIITVSQSAGTVDIRNVNLTLYGNCSFIGNIGTGLRAESSLVGVNGNITFLRNTGILGGALYLVTYAYLIMNRNSSIYFIENEARIGGGAIYVNENGLNSYLVGGFQDCFIHFAYDDFNLCEDCSDLDSYGVFIKFSGNSAASGGSMVSGSSLITCPWAYNFIFRENVTRLNQSVFEILDQNFSNVFSFDQPPNKPALVRSTAANLRVDHLSDSNSDVAKVFPGQVFYANISAVDDFNNTIANVIAAYASSNTPTVNRSTVTPFLSSNAFGVLSDNIPTTIPIRILGMENQSISLVIYSTDPAGRAQEQINVMLYSCGFGFLFDTQTRICACDSRLESLGISCNNETQEIIVPDGLWIGPFSDEIVVHGCIFRYCEPGEKSIVIQSPDDTEVDFDVQCDASMNRTGFLCSSCRAGYSAVLGSRTCRQCSNLYILLFPVFVAIGILAIIIIRYLNITITAGFINGAIFYSNIVSLYGSTLVPGGTLTNGAIVLVSFPTLNLGFETCLHDKMNTLEKVWWQLSFPLYLFVLMGITSLLARTKYLKFNRSSGLSTIQAFATLLILCYVSVLEACIELVGFRIIRSIDGIRHVQWISDPVVKYFGPEHGALGFLAYLILAFYIIPLPFFLLFPSFLYRNRHFSKFKPIYDAFWDPYKPKYRFYLGFRLIFRWIPFALAVFVRPPISIFVTNFLLIILVAVQVDIQPFREKWRNKIDAIFLYTLALLFSGSTFFWSEYGFASQNDRSLVTTLSLAYSSILIIFAFLVMLIIFVYHIMVRFPKLRALLGRCLNRTPLLKMYNIQPPRSADVPTSPDTEVAEEAVPSKTYSSNATNNGSNGKTQPVVITASELREPLLESGTVDVYDVDPTSVPTRIQTSY